MAWAIRPFLAASSAKYPQAVPVSKACVGFRSFPFGQLHLETTAIKTGACLHHDILPSFINDKKVYRSSALFAYINFQCWIFAAEGAHLAASNKLLRVG